MSSSDVKSVKGNVPDELKRIILTIPRRFTGINQKGFAASVEARLKIIEISTRLKECSPEREEAMVVCEIEVTEDMTNGAANMHGGCAAYLIDMCTSLPIAVFLKGRPSVSQAINMIYHAPAPLGTPLRIISTTIAVGGRAMSCRGEIWDTKNSRLVASGVQVKMLPSKPKL